MPNRKSERLRQNRTHRESPGSSRSLAKLGEKSTVMNKTHVLLSAALFLVGTAASQAQEKLQPPKQAAPSSQEILPAPTPSGPGVRQTQPAPIATAPGEKETLPAPTGVAPAAGAGDCNACANGWGGCHHLTCEQFKRWLFFCPQKGPGLCGCCNKFQPCCNPYLYTFFLCRDHNNTLPPHVLPAHDEDGTDGCGWGHKCLQWLHRPACCEAEQATAAGASAGNAGTVSWEEPVKSKK